MNEFFRQLGADAARLWGQLTAAQRLLIGLVGVLSVGLVVGLVVWAQSPNYTALYSRLSPADAGAIMGKLKEQNIPVHVVGNTIMVPDAKVHELRLNLAAEGLPSGGTVGFGELFNGAAGWSQTDFEKRLNYQRGLQGELERTIGAIGGVDGARVHIVMPKDSLFTENEEPTTASVLLHLAPGGKLSLEQIRTIQHLVARGVPKLAAENVFITDGAGRNYTDELAQMDPKNLQGTDLTSRQLEIKKRYEREMERKLQSQLDQVLGANNAVVRVNTMWDFSQVETNAETYTPSVGQGGILLSEKGKDENYVGGPSAAGDVPGNNPNVTPQYQAVRADAAGSYSNHEFTRNYNTNREVQRRIKEPALMRDITVAVAVNSPPARPAALRQGEMAGVYGNAAMPGNTAQMNGRANWTEADVNRFEGEIRQLVAGAAGIPIADAATKVQVNTMAFNMRAGEVEDERAKEMAWEANMRRYGGLGALALMAILALGLLFLSFRRRRRQELQEIEEALPSLPADDLGITLIDEGEEGLAPLNDGPGSGEMPSGTPDETRLVEMQRELAAFIKKQPKDAVKLVRAWMTDED